MKKITFLPIFILMFSAMGLVSCETETLDSDLVNMTDPTLPENPGGGNTGGGNNGGSNNGGGNAQGDYWPAALNNMWTYSVTGGSSESIKIIATETIDGKQYYKFDNVFGMSGNGSVAGNATMWLRKESGNYNIRVKAATTAGADLSAIEYTLLKDNIAAGQTWTQNLIQNITFTIPGIPAIQQAINIQGKIIEKGISIQVGSQTYTDVIHSEITQSASGVTTVTQYYFAKGKGPVKVVMSGADIDRTMNLTSSVIN